MLCCRRLGLRRIVLLLYLADTMQTVLFHETVFGPIHSRRLGVSLGVNLMPNDGKICSFDCLYCEAGFNAQGQGTTGVPTRESVKRALRNRLAEMQQAGDPLDVITFSGNGEPTLHPDFKNIVHDVINLRNHYYPQAKVSVLSNSTMLHKPQVVEALKLVDNNILKLDSAIPHTFRILNRPGSTSMQPAGVVEHLKMFAGQCIVQTMFVRGSYEGVDFDNTTPEEVDALLYAYEQIKPREVMIYSIDRATPAQNLVHVSAEELEQIASRLREAGLVVQVNA